MDYYGSTQRPKMLKHSINHLYGQTGVPLSPPQQQQQQHIPIISGSSHSGEIPISQQQIDPTRFLEGPHHHLHSQSKSYLDQSYPTQTTQVQGSGQNTMRAHTPSRLFLDTSRIPTTIPRGIISGSGKDDGLKMPPGMNGSIYFSPTSPQNIQNQTTNVNSPINTSSNNPNQNTTTSSANTTSNNETVVNTSSASSKNFSNFRSATLRSLALLSILSLLLALNSLIFLLKIVWPFESGHSLSSDANQMQMMYELTLCLSAMSLSINLCVLLICSAQYMFAISGTPSSTSFLRKVTLTRGIAIGGFFLSVPLFLSAIVLYTFTHLTLSTTALISTACVGGSIILGGCAMIFHVFHWQKEKTNKSMLVQPNLSPSSHSRTLELSTLV